jgi:N6-adenosine-specific RNA methylase IME4
MTLLAHPFADAFPLIEGEEFDDFVEDIREHGLRRRIDLFENAILDGRNRYNALLELAETGELLGPAWGHRAGEVFDRDLLEPSPDNFLFRSFNPYVDGDPIDYVASLNLRRRDLKVGQRAYAVAELGRLGWGGDRSKPSREGLSAERRAQLGRVGRATVERAQIVADHGAPELKAAVKRGELPVAPAEALARLPHDEQAAILAAAGGDEKAILAAAKSIRARDRRIRFDQVNEKLAQISEDSKPLPGGQRFPIIYADPATRYVSGFGDRSIENHYPTMPIAEICAMNVRELATDRAVLFIWTTIPQLRNTMAIIEAWGFEYVSAWCWDKVDHGTGHWGFNQHEELLIATRGGFPAPVPGTQPRSLFSEKKTDHSVKPDWFAEQIERIWPKLPKIELFARNQRPGWEVWGNQAGVSRSEIAQATGATPSSSPAPTSETSDDDSEAA